MAVTPSSMLALGSPLPRFDLLDTVSGNRVSSESALGSVTVIAVICNHCPFVVHIKPGLSKFAVDYQPKGVKLVAVSANDVTTHPMDGPLEMAEDARRHTYAFPYVYDESQQFVLALGARCTPEFYVFEAQGRLAYRGQFDDARPNKTSPVTGADIRAAVDALLDGRAPSPDQKPSMGCSIKWKPGNAPG